MSEALPERNSSWLVSVFVTAFALWLGAAVFVSAGVLPTLFMNLEPSRAGEIAALIFPVYFRAGLAVGIVASVAAAAIAVRGGRRWKVACAVLVVMTLAQAWSTLVVHPEMASIRGIEAEVPRFQSLHKLSVRLNGVVLAGGVLIASASGYLLARRRDEA